MPQIQEAHILKMLNIELLYDLEIPFPVKYPQRTDNRYS